MIAPGCGGAHCFASSLVDLCQLMKLMETRNLLPWNLMLSSRFWICNWYFHRLHHRLEGMGKQNNMPQP